MGGNVPVATVFAPAEVPPFPIRAKDAAALIPKRIG